MNSCVPVCTDERKKKDEKEKKEQEQPMNENWHFYNDNLPKNKVRGELADWCLA